jgi:hypothetical protein
MIELWRWVMLASKRFDATAADHAGSNRGITARSRLAERGFR